MVTFQIKAKTRKKGDKLDKNSIFGVLYGPSIKNKNLTILKNEFDKIYFKAGKSNFIDLIIDEEKAIKVLVKDIQRNPVKDNIVHVDFYKTEDNKKIKVDIPLNFIGVSRTVKELGGLLVKNLEYISVECFPKDLLPKIDVDLSRIKDFTDIIKVKDLGIKDDIIIKTNINAMVVNSISPKRNNNENKTENKEDKKKDVKDPKDKDSEKTEDSKK